MPRSPASSAPRSPDDWTEPGLIVSKEDGNPYVITDEDEAAGAPAGAPPVINITSAKLILGENSEPRIVPQAAIDEQTVGEDIGILGAPGTPALAVQLIDTGWTACTDEGRRRPGHDLGGARPVAPTNAAASSSVERRPTT